MNKELTIGKEYIVKGAEWQAIPIAKLNGEKYLFLVPGNIITPFVTWCVEKVEGSIIDCCCGRYYRDLDGASVELPLSKPEPYGADVMRNLRMRKGLEPDDTSKDEELTKEFSPLEALEEALEWEGIVGYTRTIVKFIDDVTGLDLYSKL